MHGKCVHIYACRCALNCHFTYLIRHHHNAPFSQHSSHTPKQSSHHDDSPVKSYMLPVRPVTTNLFGAESISQKGLFRTFASKMQAYLFPKTYPHIYHKICQKSGPIKRYNICKKKVHSHPQFIAVFLDSSNFCSDLLLLYSSNHKIISHSSPHERNMTLIDDSLPLTCWTIYQNPAAALLF